MAGLALRVLRTPINATASLVGVLGGACSGCEYKRVQIAEGLHGVSALAPGADGRHLILYFHGGGHWLLTADTYREFIGRLSAVTGARVVAVEYHKPPAVKFPAGLHDALAAWQWAESEHPNSSVAVAGDSSGANLAFALVIHLAKLGMKQPAACVGISPWLRLDLESTWHLYGRFCVRLYLGGKGRAVSPADPLVSPVNADADLVRRLPPILMHAGEREMTTEGVKEMAAVCEAAGAPAEVQYYKAPHIFQVTAGFPKQTRDSLKRIDDFLQKHW